MVCATGRKRTSKVEDYGVRKVEPKLLLERKHSDFISIARKKKATSVQTFPKKRLSGAVLPRFVI